MLFQAVEIGHSHEPLEWIDNRRFNIKSGIEDFDDFSRQTKSRAELAFCNDMQSELSD